ncbi:hypothetical protein KAW18_10190 [candidate division WOR-3 bacterium]|nr:hypothetical protein [candidate division WOR-3 bacterium]
MVWTATLKTVEYNEPIYRLIIMLKNDGLEAGEETVDIEDSLSIEDATERIKDKLRERIQAESLGAKLNKYIGKEITL